jgi:hypothetical protein
MKEHIRNMETAKLSRAGTFYHTFLRTQDSSPFITAKYGNNNNNNNNNNYYYYCARKQRNRKLHFKKPH